MKGGSARVFSQKEDMKERSTKKVKTREEVDLNQSSDCMDIVVQDQADIENKPKATYKDSLLKSPGMVPEDESMNMDDIDEESPDPEDRWYKDTDKDDLEDRPFDPCPTIPVSKEEFEDWCKPWRNALIIKVLGKRVGLAFLEQRLKRDWVKKGTIHVIDMDRDYFLVHFSDEENYSHALLEGPWMIAGHYLIVQRWRPFFLKSEHHVRKIAVWVRIPNLPIELYNHRFLWRVGSAIGHMLKIDRNTSIHSRGRFARICVEIDLAKKLVPRISVLGSELNIEYEGLYQICFSCGRYGHRMDQCNETVVESAEHRGSECTGDQQGTNKESGDTSDQIGKSVESGRQHEAWANQSSPDFGPWMLVRRQIRKKKPPITYGKGGTVHSNVKGGISGGDDIGVDHVNHEEGSGSRYNILYEEEPGGTNMHKIQETMDRQTPLSQDGLHVAKAQNSFEKSQPIYKKVLKQGASKNPQGIRKQNHVAIGPRPTEKGNKLKSKSMDQDPPKSKEPKKGNIVEFPKEGLPETVTHAEKKQEMAAMEMVMLEHMRHLQDEQREAFEISRRSPSLLEAHVVKNRFLTQTQNFTPLLKP
ncbi:hypothetical protein S83_032677 [Arachis hypogaea]